MKSDAKVRVFYVWRVYVLYFGVERIEKIELFHTFAKKKHILIVLALAYMRKKLYLCTEN